MESISSRVLIWTVVEALVLVGVAYWQVSQSGSQLAVWGSGGGRGLCVK